MIFEASCIVSVCFYVSECFGPVPEVRLMAGFLEQDFSLLSQEVSQVFSHVQLVCQKEITIVDAFKNISKLYKKHIRSWWEVSSLETYIKNWYNCTWSVNSHINNH